MRPLLALALLAAAACPGEATAPAPQTRNDVPPEPAPPLASPPAAPSPVHEPTTAPSVRSDPGETAVVYGERGLALVEIEQATARTILEAPVTACLADPAAGAIWFVAEHDDSLALWVHDLQRSDPPARLIDDVPQSVGAIALATWRGGTIASGSAAEFELGIHLDLRSTPQIRRMVGCMADVFECFSDVRTETLRPELEAIAKTVEALRYRDPGTAKRIGDRAAGPLAPTRPNVAPKVAIASTPCEADPESCGSAIELPGTSLLLVVVGNSQGDLYHEDVALYDPKARVFMPLSDPRKTSPEPPAEADELTRLWLAPSGQAYAYDQAVVHLQRGPLHTGATACGFTSAGPIITPPRA